MKLLLRAQAVSKLWRIFCSPGHSEKPRVALYIHKGQPYPNTDTSLPTALPNQGNATSEKAGKYFQELTLKHFSLLQGIYSHRKIHVNMTNKAKFFQ